MPRLRKDIPGYGPVPDASSTYGTRAPVTQWKDTEYHMRRQDRQPKSLGALIGLQAAWRVGLPLILGFGTDFLLHHSLDLKDDAAFSVIYTGIINGGERLLYALGSSHRENARRRGQRHDSLVAEATRRRTQQRNARDQRIADDARAEGAEGAKVTSRAGAALDALRGNGVHPKPNNRP